jgi:hypothetical protein
MQKALLAILFTAYLGFPTQPAWSEEAETLVAPGVPQPMPSIANCKQVLEQGRVVKIDANGALHIPFDNFWFVIEVDEKEMRCRMYRHIMQ